MNKLIKKIVRKILHLSRIVSRFILQIINFFLIQLGLKIFYQREINYQNSQTKALTLFYAEALKDTRKLKTGTSCIIFSMDRAIQLHALLGSLSEKLSSPIPTFVIYRSTSPEHEKAYSEVFNLFSKQLIYFIKQESKETFASQLINTLKKIETSKLFFLVDDILVTENILISDFETINSAEDILSLRLGANLNFSYVVQKSQPLPSFLPLTKNQNDKICWRWDNGQYDWAYPLSVDGHLFLTKDVLAMARSISFNSPNTYEGNLQIFKPLFDLRLGLAYKKSKLFNIPCNKVQSDIENLHGEIHQDELLKKWNDGYQIDYRALYGFNNIGVHQDVAFSFIKRNE